MPEPKRYHTPEDFNESYRSTPPWDIGRPQPAFVALADAGALHGAVLDVGCGTGEHALLAAARGLDATGVDSSPIAIARAQEKARERGLAVSFVVGDVLDLSFLPRQFDCVLDSGLFHVFSDEHREQFVRSLGGVVPAGGRHFLMCFSDRQPGDWGPRRVTEEEIRASFATGWRVDSIAEAKFDVLIQPEGVYAWLATITRI